MGDAVVVVAHSAYLPVPKTSLIHSANPTKSKVSDVFWSPSYFTIIMFSYVNAA